MGYDIPSAVGAAMANPNDMVLCIVGDGSILMNIQELATIKERDLNIKIVVLNNRRLGMVSQFQLITKIQTIRTILDYILSYILLLAIH